MKTIIPILLFCFGISLQQHALSQTLSPEYFLDLLIKLPLQSDFETVQNFFPDHHLELKEDAGENNQEALLEVALYGIPMTAEFNFSNHRLVSHGVSARGLTMEQSMEAFQQVVSYLRQQCGPPSWEDINQSGGDGHESVGNVVNWTIDGISFGVSNSDIYDGFQLSWGAQ